MNKRLSCMVSAALAALLMLAGCGGGETQSPSSGQGGDTPVSLDFGGEEIILAYPWSLNSPDSSPAAERHYQYVQELNAKYHAVSYTHLTLPTT